VAHTCKSYWMAKE
jgi:hypothetical protein